jgi:hypothetical protein
MFFPDKLINYPCLDKVGSEKKVGFFISTHPSSRTHDLEVIGFLAPVDPEKKVGLVFPHNHGCGDHTLSLAVEDMGWKDVASVDPTPSTSQQSRLIDNRSRLGQKCNSAPGCICFLYQKYIF